MHVAFEVRSAERTRDVLFFLLTCLLFCVCLAGCEDGGMFASRGKVWVGEVAKVIVAPVKLQR